MNTHTDRYILTIYIYPQIIHTYRHVYTYSTPGVVIMLHIYVYGLWSLKTMIIKQERFLTHSNGF